MLLKQIIDDALHKAGCKDKNPRIGLANGGFCCRLCNIRITEGMIQKEKLLYSKNELLNKK
jgi:hypothetical protein